MNEAIPSRPGFAGQYNGQQLTGQLKTDQDASFYASTTREGVHGSVQLNSVLSHML